MPPPRFRPCHLHAFVQGILFDAGLGDSFSSTKFGRSVIELRKKLESGVDERALSQAFRRFLNGYLFLVFVVLDAASGQFFESK